MIALVIAVVLLAAAVMVLSSPPSTPVQWLAFALALLALLITVVAAIRGGHVL